MDRNFIISVLISMAMTFTGGTIQPLHADEFLGTYEEVVSVDGATQNDLYFRCKNWFAKTFVSANNVIQMDDKDGATVLGKGTIAIKQKMMVIGQKQSGFVRFAVTVQAKDGRYRYLFEEFVHNATDSAYDGGSLSSKVPVSKTMGGWTTKMWNYVQETTDREIKGLIKSLKLEMSKPVKKDDW